MGIKNQGEEGRKRGGEYVWNMYMCIQTYIHIYNIYILNIPIYIYMCVYSLIPSRILLDIYREVSIYTYVYTYMYLYYICKNKYIYISLICMCICVRIYIILYLYYIYIYVLQHIHMNQ